jgi:ABC-type transporter Mla subunit MlaD
MRNRRDNASLLTSPIMVGAVTVLVTVIAVFLSYNANEGLPFVPTYGVTIEVQDAAGLVPGNEARIGGKRVGVVEEIDAIKHPKGPPTAELTLKLDLNAKPIREDTQVTVRPRSTLGLKYLELRPGKHGRNVGEGGRLALKQSQPVVDLDEVVNTFDASTRQALKVGTGALGPGLTGRGISFNATLADAPSLFTHLDAVMANLGDPRTRLGRLIPALERVASAVAPVSGRLGSMIESADVTFGALSEVRERLGESVSELPATESQATHTLRVARPLLADATLLMRDARPGTRLLPTATLTLDDAIDTGIPVLRRALTLADDLKATLGAVETLSRDPATTSALQKLDATLTFAGPLLAYVTPMQTRCNYLGLWTRNANSSISEGDANGNWFRTLVLANTAEFTSAAKPAPELHDTPYPHTAAPGQDGECEAGNEGYEPGQRIGNPPGNQGRSTEPTDADAGRGQP